MMAIATEQGLWEKHGLEVQAAKFTNGPLQIQALGAGDLDFGYIGPGAFWLPASGQAKIIAINTVGLGDRVVAHPDSGIKTIADLAGKRIGVPEGTSGEMILRLALEKAGLDIADVEKVAMDPSTVVSSFASGQIDAAGIWYPLVGTMKKQVPDAIELVKSKDFYPEISFPGAFVGRNKVVADDPEFVRQVLQVVHEANDFRAENLEEAIKITSEFIDVPVDQLTADAENAVFLKTDELVASTKDKTIDGWIETIEEMFVDFGKLKSVVPPTEFYRGDLYAEAAES
jgi:NitT/TauT family transport system substrate-binding protein